MPIMTFIEPVSDVVMITIVVVLGIMAISGFATIAGILMYAMHNGYNAKAVHRTHGPLPFDDELSIVVTKA